MKLKGGIKAGQQNFQQVFAVLKDYL